MSGTAELIGKVIDTAIIVILGDKVSAARQREIRRTIEAVHAGEITEQEAYERLRFGDGDALDQALGKPKGGWPDS